MLTPAPPARPRQRRRACPASWPHSSPSRRLQFPGGWVLEVTVRTAGGRTARRPLGCGWRQPVGLSQAARQVGSVGAAPGPPRPLLPAPRGLRSTPRPWATGPLFLMPAGPPASPPTPRCAGRGWRGWRGGRFGSGKTASRRLGGAQRAGEAGGAAESGPGTGPWDPLRVWTCSGPAPGGRGAWAGPGRGNPHPECLVTRPW